MNERTNERSQTSSYVHRVSADAVVRQCLKFHCKNNFMPHSFHAMVIVFSCHKYGNRQSSCFCKCVSFFSPFFHSYIRLYILLMRMAKHFTVIWMTEMCKIERDRKRARDDFNGQKIDAYNWCCAIKSKYSSNYTTLSREEFPRKMDKNSDCVCVYVWLVWWQ